MWNYVNMYYYVNMWLLLFLLTQKRERVEYSTCLQNLKGFRKIQDAACLDPSTDIKTAGGSVFLADFCVFFPSPPQKKKAHTHTFFPMFVTLPKTTNKFAPENWQTCSPKETLKQGQTCCEFQGVCLEDHPRTDVKWLMTIGFRFRPLRNVPLPNGQTSLHGL